MFEALKKGFLAARQKLTGIAELSSDNIDPALRDVRLSLLEADVEIGVVKKFLARVKERALGSVVQVRGSTTGTNAIELGAGDVFVKICHEELIRMLADDRGEDIVWAPKGTPTVIMMVGLQGQGKTTTSAKLARLFHKQNKRVLLVAADLQRPAAIDQLETLAKKIGPEVPVFANRTPGASPVEVCKQALAIAKVQKRDVVIFDTAGRLAIDDRLMQELADIKRETQPQNILLVVNAAVGQNALQTATQFHERLSLNGVVLTMLDGDARGGAALSIREVTGVPIKFAGVGETIDKLEPFRPDGMAGRILGMGDIVGLYKDFTEQVNEEKAQEQALRILNEQFTFDDFLEQISTIQKMGPLKDLIEKMEGLFPAGAMPADMNVDDREMDKIRAIIHSMTKKERADSSLFAKQPSRIDRVAKGSGRTTEEISDLIEKFNMMRGFLGGIGRQAGMLSKIPGAKQLAMANRLRQMLKSQGGDENQAMGGLAAELLQQAVASGGMPGMGAGGMPGMPGLARAAAGGAGGDGFNLFDFLNENLGGAGAAGARRRPNEEQKKKQRKQERQARKKARRK